MSGFNLRITALLTTMFYENVIFDPSLKKINGLDFPTFHEILRLFFGGQIDPNPTFLSFL